MILSVIVSCEEKKVMLCYVNAMLCNVNAVLCYVMLCYVMLCYVTLYYVNAVILCYVRVIDQV